MAPTSLLNDGFSTDRARQGFLTSGLRPALTSPPFWTLADVYLLLQYDWGRRLPSSLVISRTRLPSLT